MTQTGLEAQKMRLAALMKEAAAHLKGGEPFPKGRVGAIRAEAARLPEKVVVWFFEKMLDGVVHGRYSPKDVQDLAVVIFGKYRTLTRLVVPLLLAEQIKVHRRRRKSVDGELAGWVPDPQEVVQEREASQVLRVSCVEQLSGGLAILEAIKAYRPEMDELEVLMERYDKRLHRVDKRIHACQRLARQSGLRLSALQEILRKVKVLERMAERIKEKATAPYYRLRDLNAGVLAMECDLGLVIRQGLEHMLLAEVRLEYEHAVPERAVEHPEEQIQEEATHLVAQQLLEVADEVRNAKRPIAVRLPGGPMRLRRHHADALKGIALEMMGG